MVSGGTRIPKCIVTEVQELYFVRILCLFLLLKLLKKKDDFCTLNH